MRIRAKIVSIKSLFFIGSVLVLFSGVTYSYELASWLTVEYKPVDKKVEGIPLSNIDKSWSQVLVLTKDNQPPELQEDLKADEEYGYKFQIVSDFNKDGKRDKPLVGVYQEQGGATGRFLLILTEEKPGTWKKVFLHKEEGKPGFSILNLKGETLFYSFCMECDSSAELSWEENHYILSWKSCCEEDD